MKWKNNIFFPFLVNGDDLQEVVFQDSGTQMKE